MKLPSFNFIQLCFVMTMLGLVALTAIFGLRGNMPAWLLMVNGNHQPPAAQVELTPLAELGFMTKATVTKIDPAEIAHIQKRMNDIRSKREISETTFPLVVKQPQRAPKFNIIPELPPAALKGTKSSLPAVQLPTYNPWQTWFALTALLTLISLTFRKSLFTTAN